MEQRRSRFPPGDCNVTFDFDDSIISDPKERKQMYWGYVTAGKFPFWRYLVEFEGYSEDDAKAIAAEADAENRSPEALTFGVPDAAAVLPRPDAGCLCAALAASRRTDPAGRCPAHRQDGQSDRYC